MVSLTNKCFGYGFEKEMCYFSNMQVCGKQKNQQTLFYDKQTSAG